MVVSADLVKRHIIWACVWMIAGMLVGFLTAYRLTGPESASFLESIPFLSYGRIRMLHTNAIAYGWLTNGLIAFAYYAVPKLTGTKLALGKLADLNVWILQLAIVVTAVGILGGFAEGVEYAEGPWWADIIVAIAFVITVLSIVLTALKAKPKAMYVSLWYILLAFLFTALNFVMANTIVAHIAPGAPGAALEGLWIHNIVGLWVTPMGTAIVYYLLPVILKKPIASHKLSLIGFWTLAFIYPLGGSHHFFFSPVPWWLQMLSVPLTFALIFVVYTVVYNFFATMKGEWKQIAGNLPLRFLVFGIFSYILTCTQGPFHALLSVQQVVHFTDWIVAHAHLALFGVFSLWIVSFVYWSWPKIAGREVRSRKLMEWHFWLWVLGFFLLYYIPDTIAGLAQGMSWMNGEPIIDSLKDAQPFWITRAISGVAITVGGVFFVMNLFGGKAVEEQANV